MSNGAGTTSFAATYAANASSWRPDRSSATPDGSGDRDATFELVSGVALRGGYAGFGAPDPDVRDIARFQTILSGDLAGNDDSGGTALGPTVKELLAELRELRLGQIRAAERMASLEKRLRHIDGATA